MTDLREHFARIIDPDAWLSFDDFLHNPNRTHTYRQIAPNTDDVAELTAWWMHEEATGTITPRIRRSLAKAGAIVAMMEIS